MFKKTIIILLGVFSFASAQVLIPNSIQWWHLTQAAKDSLVVNAETASADTIKQISSIVLKDSMDFDWLEDSLNTRDSLIVDSTNIPNEGIVGANIKNSSISYIKIDSASFFNWLNAISLLDTGAVNFIPISDPNYLSVTLDFLLPALFGGGTPDYSFGITNSFPDINLANLEDSLNTRANLISDSVMIGIITYDKLDSQSVYTWINANGALASTSLDFYPFDSNDMTGVLGDFIVPSPLTASGGTISITAGETATDLAWDFDAMLDSLIENALFDSVGANQITISDVWTFSQEPDFTGGLGDGNIDDNITASNYLLKADFGDSLNLNFGKGLPDSINVVRNNRSIVLATAVIDSFQIVSAGKHFVGYLTQDIQIDTVFAVWDAGIGSNPSVDIMLKFGKNLGLTGTNIFSSDQTISSTSVGHKITSFSETAIGHGNMLWVTFPSISDKLDQLILVIIGKVTSNE